MEFLFFHIEYIHFCFQKKRTHRLCGNNFFFGFFGLNKKKLDSKKKIRCHWKASFTEIYTCWICAELALQRVDHAIDGP
jgi:hypothetical protein